MGCSELVTLALQLTILLQFAFLCGGFWEESQVAS